MLKDEQKQKSFFTLNMKSPRNTTEDWRVKKIEFGTGLLARNAMRHKGKGEIYMWALPLPSL